MRAEYLDGSGPMRVLHSGWETVAVAVTVYWAGPRTPAGGVCSQLITFTNIERQRGGGGAAEQITL